MKRLRTILCDGGLLFAFAIVAVNGYAIRDELTAGRFDLNDSVFHYTLIGRMAQAIQHGAVYNMACVVIILGSAVFMYLLGRLYFGRAGGWLAAAAYALAAAWSAALGSAAPFPSIVYMRAG